MHCESSAIRNVLEYHGVKLSEELVFGLDCTFGFAYWKQKYPYRPFSLDGKVYKFPNTLPSFLGIEVKEKTTDDLEEAWKSVKKLIDNDVPVPIFVDIYYLDYLRVPKEPWNHFGAHMIVLVGYDEERKEAYCVDSIFTGLQVVSLENLAKARNSKYEPCPPRNTWFEIHVPGRTKPLDEAVNAAIKETAMQMLNPSDENFSIKGMRKLAEEIVDLFKLFSKKQLKLF